MFEKKIMTIKELGGGKQSASDIWHKAVGTMTTPALIPHFARMILRGKRRKYLIETLPQQYDAHAIAQWERAYTQF